MISFYKLLSTSILLLSMLIIIFQIGKYNILCIMSTIIYLILQSIETYYDGIPRDIDGKII